MVGPVPSLYGGISKVVGSFLEASLPDMELDYVATSTKRAGIYKTAVFVCGLGCIFLKLIFQRPDVVHLHFSKGASLYRKFVVQKIAHLFKVPVVVHSHSFGPRIEAKRGRFTEPDFFSQASFLSRRIISQVLDGAEAILVLSERIRFCFQNITRNKNIWVLFNPVDCEKYTPEDRKREGRTMLFLGDFSEEKGIKTLIKAVTPVINELTEARFILCGGKREDIAEIVEDWGVESHVEIPGFVSGKKKVEVFKNADLFVLPSYKEGLPVAVLEALSSGLPIITTPVGGIPDVIKEYQNGLFVDPGDHKALAEKITFLLKNEDVRKKIGENNRKKALDEFNTDVVIKDLRRIYTKVVRS